MASGAGDPPRAKADEKLAKPVVGFKVAKQMDGLSSLSRCDALDAPLWGMDHTHLPHEPPAQTGHRGALVTRPDQWDGLRPSAPPQLMVDDWNRDDCQLRDDHEDRNRRTRRATDASFDARSAFPPRGQVQAVYMRWAAGDARYPWPHRRLKSPKVSVAGAWWHTRESLRLE